MRFLMMHRLDERAPEASNPGQEFIEKMGAFIQDSIDKGHPDHSRGRPPLREGRAAGSGLTSARIRPLVEGGQVRSP